MLVNISKPHLDRLRLGSQAAALVVPNVASYMALLDQHLAPEAVHQNQFKQHEAMQCRHALQVITSDTASPKPGMNYMKLHAMFLLCTAVI